MTLNFVLGDSHNFLYDNSTASNDALWSATRAMVRRMQDELWGYFGLAVLAGGSYPKLTLRSASGGNAAAQAVALAQLNRDRAFWGVARGRLDALIKGQGRIFGHDVRVSLRAFSYVGSMIGWETLESGHTHAS